jgi:protease I
MRQIVPVLVGPEYEDLEVWYPKLRLEEAGFAAPLLGMGDAEYRGKHGYPAKTDGKISDVKADELAGVIVPGGWAPDKLRRERAVLALVQKLNADEKLVASICHGPWVLISAGIMKGRRCTSSLGIKDDLLNAGASWFDEPAVVDHNIVTARVPKDLPAFMLAVLAFLR